MGTYVLRQAVQWSFFGTHGNMPGSSQPDTRETLGLAIRLVFLLLLIFAIADRSTAIAGFTLGQKLTGVGGNAVAIAGERIVVGAPAEDGAKGAVHVYRYNSSTATWIEEQKLIALDGAAGDQFGISVAIAGDQIAVGAPFDSDNGSQSGSAYVFRYYPESMTWIQEQKIIASDGAPNDFFGVSTGMAGNRIVIGSPLHDDMVSRSGAVYVYQAEQIAPGQTIWVEEQKLVASDRTEEDSLGWSVATDGDRIVAGAIQTNNCSQCGGRPGAAYVFNRSSGIWGFEAKLTPSDGIGGDYFGESVSISGERIAVATASGRSVYVFRRDDITQWVPDQKLGPFYENLGPLSFPPRSTVAIAGDRLVVGAPRSNTDLRGAVHLFEFDPSIGGTGAWAQQQILTGGDENMVCCRFGRPLAISGEEIVVGELASEAVYIFRFTADSDGDGVPDNQDQCPNTPSGAAVDTNGCAPSQLDTDMDSVTDDQDQCPNSDIRPTVIIGTCDSGITNALLSDQAGCTITDEIIKLADAAKSHGQFVSQVDKFLLELQKAGILEPNEKNAIRDCAAQSNLP